MKLLSKSRVGVAGALLQFTLASQPVQAAAKSGSIPHGLAIEFELQVDRDPRVKGQLQLDTRGNTCVAVQIPLDQRVWLGSEGASIYYRASGDLLRHKPTQAAMPAFVDAVVVSLVDPVASLPQGARQLSRREANGMVTTKWRVADADNRIVQLMEVEEVASGVVALTLKTEGGTPLRSYRFGPRTRFGRLAIPTEITATYHALQKGRKRSEHWLLQAPKKIGAQPLSEANCLGISGPVKEKRW